MLQTQRNGRRTKSISSRETEGYSSSSSSSSVSLPYLLYRSAEEKLVRIGQELISMQELEA